MTRTLDFSKQPYSMPQPRGMRPDLFLSGALDLDADQDAWVPQADGIWFRPLLLSVSEGYYVNLLRVTKSGVLSRHRHSGPVHAMVLRGTWRYLEHNWTATAGDYAFEPPGETHTLVVPDDCSEMITLFHVSGGYVYVDPQGVLLGYEDVFTKLASASRHYEALGLGERFVEQFVR
ncbi:cupin [Mesorhizobium sp. LSHC420B00]|nr:cupin [Mesorhizobium sp. LSHC420B00]